jgi:hypothetical protein
MPDDPLSRGYLLRYSADPLRTRPKNAEIPVRWVEPGFAPLGQVVEGIRNWDYYDGAIVGVGVTDGKTFTISGSGVMVAPGLVLTATHVVDEHSDALEAKTLTLYCLGVRSGGRADLWTLRTLRYPEDESDIAFLGVELCSEIADDWHVSCMPLSTRAPREGESLTIVGFRFEDPCSGDDLGDIDGVPVVSRGQLYAAAGETEAVWYPYRDRVLMPFPTIEITCGSLGGMSGGAVMDRDGAVVGVLSTGLSHEDGRGPSNAAWIIHALMFRVNLIWPPGLYTPETPILDLPGGLIKIVGRDRVRLTGPNQIDYTIWH